ncbi:hypothetical protein C8039_03360 [Halogeometricum sp. wsp3]|nr:hypothetical protein C8039_03360 [Halogeometricum sp. wsp3]
MAVELFPLVLSISLIFVGVLITRGQFVGNQFVGRILAWMSTGPNWSRSTPVAVTASVPTGAATVCVQAQWNRDCWRRRIIAPVEVLDR